MSGHLLAITAHVGPPTYPAPIQQIFVWSFSTFSWIELIFPTATLTWHRLDSYTYVAYACMYMNELNYHLVIIDFKKFDVNDMYLVYVLVIQSPVKTMNQQNML